MFIHKANLHSRNKNEKNMAHVLRSDISLCLKSLSTGMKLVLNYSDELSIEACFVYTDNRLSSSQMNQEDRIKIA